MKKIFFILVFLLCLPSTVFSQQVGGWADGSGSASIDDTKGNGDTTYTWSADKIYDQLALKQDADAYYIKKAAAAFTEGHLVKTDANGDLVSAGAPIDLTSTITQNVETSGYLSGKMRAVIVAVPSGVHDGSNDQALMTDGGIDLGADTLIGMTVYNITDGSSCTITDNAATTITCTLAGGTGNDWDTNDVWQVGPGPAQSGSVFYVGSAGTIRHPATAGYLAGYYTTAAAAVIINPASDSMVIKNATASAIDAGDCVDSPATAGSYIFLHNASATLAYTLGKNGTYTDGGAD